MTLFDLPPMTQPVMIYMIAFIIFTFILDIIWLYDYGTVNPLN